MTCIVGLEHKGKVYMGADSAAAAGWEVRATRIPKLFRRGPFLIGYTTSSRMGQLLQHRLEIPAANGKNPMTYLVSDIIEAMRQCLRDGGFTKIENNVEEGGDFLIGYANALYRIGEDFQLNTMKEGFDAIGCGREYALGVLYYTSALEPRGRLRNALRAAAHFSGGVIPPFTVKSL